MHRDMMHYDTTWYDDSASNYEIKSQCATQQKHKTTLSHTTLHNIILNCKKIKL